MDYLFKTIQREMGIAPQEEENAVEPVPAIAESPVAVPQSAPVECITNAKALPVATQMEALAGEKPVSQAPARRVPFPVKTDTLFCLRSSKMSREQRLALEQYRVLRSRVIELANEQHVRTLMVTSALAGEQKTTTSINLALAISQVQGMRVCLVDADMRKAGIAEALGIPFRLGLQDVLRDSLPLNEVMLQLTDSLSLLPSSNTDLNSADVLHSATTSALIQTLRESFDIVIIDAPPLFPVADARILANMVDGALLCVRAGNTSGPVVQEAVELIRPRLIGAILVDTQAQTSPYYYYDSKPGMQE